MPPRAWKGEKKLVNQKPISFSKGEIGFLIFMDMSLSENHVCRNRPLGLLLTGLKTCLYSFKISSFILTIVFLVIFLSHAFSEELLVAGASDLIFVFNEIGKNFESQTGNKVIFSFGSTGMLAEQIRLGAPFDVFAAADDKSIERLKNQALLKNDSIKLFAIGKLVIGYNKNIKSISEIKDLLSDNIKRVTIANPDHAPYGMAAKEALIKAELWDKLEKKLIFGESVRQSLQFIQTGNAEAGIIALSIAKVPEINYSLVDENLYPPINQTLAILKGSKREKLAREFINFICSKKGKIILERYGFKTK